MPTQRKVEFQGSFNIQEILNTINTLQNRLNGIKLDDSSLQRFQKNFSDLEKKAREIESEIQRGFSNTSQINTFNNHLQKMGQQIEVLRNEISRIDTGFDNLKLSPEIQKQFEVLRISANNLLSSYDSQISEIRSKISSLAGGMGVNLGEGEDTELAKVISSEEELARLRDNKINSLKEEKQNVESLITAYREMLDEEEKTISSTEDKRNQILKTLTSERTKYYDMPGYNKKGNTSEEENQALAKQKQVVDDLNASYKRIDKQLQNSYSKQDANLKNLNEQKESLAKINLELENASRFYQVLSGDSSGLDDDAAAASKEFTDLNNKLTQTEQKLRQANEELEKLRSEQSRKVKTGFEQSSNDLDRYNTNLKNVSESTSQYADNLERLKKHDQFFDNLSARASALFGLGNAFIYVNRFINESITAIKELDAAFTEIAVVTNMTTAQLWESFDTYNEMAQRLGTTTVDAIETSALYYQQGLDTVEVMELTEETMKMARIAGMDYAEATDRRLICYAA